MRGIFCLTKANNNEEYKKVLKSRMNLLLLMFVIGGITMAAALVVKNTGGASISERMLGVYTGVGTGLMAAAAILWAKNKRILGNEEKLRQSRLSNTDERIHEISNHAFRAAGIVLLIAIYVAGLIGGLFYPVLVSLLLCLVCVFLVTYTVAYKIYEHKM